MAQQDLRMLRGTSTVNGKEKSMIIATKIDRSSVPDAAFQPPPGYAKLEIPKGMGGITPP